MKIEKHIIRTPRLKKIVLSWIVLCLVFLIPVSSYAQGYNTPCQAESNPVTWSNTTETQNLLVDLIGAAPFNTSNAGGGIQDFGCTGTENAVFYKLELDNASSFLTIENQGGTASNVNIALISLSSTECGGGNNFGESVYLDPSGQEMKVCDLQINDPATFDLCDLMPSDFNNIYLWISSPLASEGRTNFDVTQIVGPDNDECGNATDLGLGTSRNQFCGSYTNEGACSDDISPVSRPPDPNDEPCLVNNPGLVTSSGVWFTFDTDMDGELLDILLEHTSGQQVNLGIYSAATDCNDLEPLECWSSSTGIIDNIVNFELDPNTKYYLLIYTDKEHAADFSLCIDVKPPIPCLNPALYYNKITLPPYCQVAELDQLCIDMNNNPNYRPHLWPGGCPARATVESPSWFAFVAGADRTVLEFEIEDCQLGAGVEIGLFELPCEADYNPFVPNNLPDRLRLLSDCDLTECNTGVVEMDVMTTPGRMYGVMIDGCSGDICDIEVNVIEGQDAPNIEGPLNSEIVLVNPDPNFNGDTVCVGSTGIEFMLDEEVPGACWYLWLVNGARGSDRITEPVLTYDFPNPGTYTLQLFASNNCSTNQFHPITKQIVAAELPPFETIDTICEGDPYNWIGPYGDPIIPDRPIETDFGGDYTYTGTAQNAIGCPQDGTLNLHVRNENDEYPTEIDTVICADELPLMIKGVPFTGNVQDVVVSEPTAQYGCDSFYSIDVMVLGGPFFIRPECDQLGNVIFRFEDVGGPQTSWFEQFALYNDPNNLYSIETEFIAVEKDSVISTSLPMSLTQKEIEGLAENGALNVQLRITIFYDGQVVCNSISPAVEFNLDDNFPRIDRILGDTAYCPGQKELKIYADVHHPLEPAPFGEFPDSIDTYNWFPPSGFLYDTAVQMAVDTLILSAPDNPTDNTICLKVTTERCLFTDSVCQELVIEEPIQPILEVNNETCDTFWSFTPDTASEGAWQVLDFPSSGNTAVFSDSTDPNTTVSVTNKGSYTFLWREGSTACAKYDSVTIDFLSSEVQGIVRDSCLDLNYVAEVTLVNGRGGYTIHPSSTITGTLTDSVFISDTIPIVQGPGGNFGDVLYLVVEDSLGCVSEPIPIRLVCNCESEVGPMDNEPLILCEGQSAIGNYLGGHVNDGNDTIIFILHEGSLSELQNIIDTSFTGEFPFPGGITLGRSYYISAVIGNEAGGYVDLDDPCLQVARGQEVIWYALPNSNAGMNDTVCVLNYSLSATPSVGNLSWTLVSGPGMANFTSPNSPQTNVIVSEPGSYTFQVNERNQTCEDSARVIITFAGDLEHQVSYECDSAATTYIATITLSGGGNDYFLIQGEGTLTNGVFVSDPITKNESRLIIIDTDLSCGPDSILIETDCECLTRLGSFNSDTTLANCEDACIDAGSLYDPSGEDLDGNDIGTFILHTAPDTNIRQPYFFSSDGTFCYDDISSDVDIGDTVYVAYIIGNDAGNGEVDINDPCVQISFGASVVFEGAPEADAGMADESCDLVGTLNAMNTGLDGSWTYLDGPSQNVTIDQPNAPISQVEVDMTGEYAFEWRVSQFDCEDADTIVLRFLSAPVVRNTSSRCDSTGTNYTISFEISEGDSATYTVIGGPGQLNGRQFTSDPITSDSSYRFVIFDANQCDSFIFQGRIDCECQTRIGQLMGVELHLCEDETINGISYNPTDEVRDANDGLIFVLEDAAGTRILESTDPDFAFDPNFLMLGETYFVRAYLGSVLGGVFQFDETCTQQSVAIPVQWHAYPEAIAVSSADTITCSIDTIYIDATQSTGENLRFNWSTMDGNMIPSTINSRVLGVTGSGTYTLIITDTLSGCRDTLDKQIDQSDDIPQSGIIQPDTINCINSFVILDGSPSSQGPDIEYNWSTTDGNITGATDSLRTTVNREGTYILTVTNSLNACQSQAMVRVVASSNVPEAVIASPDELNCSQASIILNGEASTQGNNIAYQWRTLGGNIIGPDQDINAEVSEAGTYWLIVENIENGCKDSVSVEVERDTAGLSEVNVELNDPVCSGESNGNIRIEALDGNMPITYILNGTIENDIGVFTDLPAGSYMIEIIDASGCKIIRNVVLEDPQKVMISLEAAIEVQEGDSVTIEAMIPAGLEYDTLIWNTDSVPYRCIDPECLTIELLPPSDMIVEVHIINGFACSDRDSTQIILQMKDDTESLYIPNVFTPDGDGLNDIFLPEAGLEVRNIHLMQIFDRWGNMLFESRDFQPGDRSNGWDGTRNGVELNPAVFTYLVEVEYNSGSTEIITGTVSLLR